VAPRATRLSWPIVHSIQPLLPNLLCSAPAHTHAQLPTKPALLLSALLTALFSTLLAIGLNTHTQPLAGASILLFVIAFSLGLAPLAWVVLADVVPPHARTAVGSVAVALNWLTNWTAGSAFIPLQKALQGGREGEGNVFYVFAACSVLGFAGMWGAFRAYEGHRERERVVR
jgi:MFS family permease